jgi:hypothetical protein
LFDVQDPSQGLKMREGGFMLMRLDTMAPQHGADPFG